VAARIASRAERLNMRVRAAKQDRAGFEETKDASAWR